MRLAGALSEGGREEVRGEGKKKTVVLIYKVHSQETSPSLNVEKRIPFK